MDRPTTPEDLEKIIEIEHEIYELNEPPKEIQWGELHRNGYHFGISYLHQFYTSRNYYVMHKLWDATNGYEQEVKDALRLLLLSYNASHCTLMTRVVAKKNAKDFILRGIERKAKSFFEAYKMYQKALFREIDKYIIEICKRAVPDARIFNEDAFKSNHVNLACGWDLVITNPPYVRYQTLKTNPEIGLPDGTELRENLIEHISNSGILDAREKQLYIEITKGYSGLSDDEMVFSCVMGFDIDPLAVVLAKVNWIMAMRDLFPYHTGQIIIPVYHADSLFVATPITHKMPSNSRDTYIMHFDRNKVEIPGHMLTPSRRRTFDAFMSICYRYAMKRAEQKESELTEEQVDIILSTIEMESQIVPSDLERQAQRIAAYGLIIQLESLQRQGRNGIWYFILNNSYKPGLVANQFNCIVSSRIRLENI